MRRKSNSINRSAPELKSWRDGVVGNHSEIKEIEEQYKFIVNAHSEMMTLINRDYVYELVNDSWCRTYGKSREDIIGKTVAEIWGEKRFKDESYFYIVLQKRGCNLLTC